MPPETAVELGLMTGVPPFPARATGDLANWQDPPYNRWGFQHVRELIPTARISRGAGQPWALPRAERDLDGLTLPIGGAGRSTSARSSTRPTPTGSWCCIAGRSCIERYLNGMTPETTHLLMSVSKSVTSAVVRRRSSAAACSTPPTCVTRHIPELAGTSWDGCTVRHLLDMRAGTKFNEDYDDLDAEVRVYEQIYLWRPTRRPHAARRHHGVLPDAREHGPHGGPSTTARS